jgi:imidazolonepropionase-like amidohydrolase
MLAIVLVALGHVAGAHASPARPPLIEEGDDAARLLVRAERLVVRPGVELANASILVEDGVILAVGTDLEVPEGAREIRGAVVCAGFLDAWSTLGIEAASVRDESTSPSTRASDAFDAFAAAQERLSALRAGVTSVRLQAGTTALAAGYGAVVRLDPELDPKRAVVLEDAGQSASVGLMRGGRERDIFDRIGEVERLIGLIEGGRKYTEDWTEYRYELEEWQKGIQEKEAELEKNAKKAKKDREKAVKEAEEKGKEHKDEAYKEEKKPRAPKPDPDALAMGRVANGEVPLVIVAHRHEEIRSLLQHTEPFARMRLLLAGATEGADHARALAERNIPVILWPSTTKPYGDAWEGHDLALAAELDEAGVTVLFGSGGTDTSRDLRLQAALAVAHGLDRDAALNAITLAPAQAFDVADRLGSVERGKDADLLVLDGDPLDTTARIQFVISHGRVVVEP